MKEFTLFLINLALAYAVGYFVGKRRQIGLEWSMFFCVFFHVAVGLIISLISPKYDAPNPTPSNLKQGFGWLFIILFSLGELILLGRAANGALDEREARVFFYGIGYIGLGYYLIKRGEGKNFNPKRIFDTN